MGKKIEVHFSAPIFLPQMICLPKRPTASIQIGLQTRSDYSLRNKGTQPEFAHKLKYPGSLIDSVPRNSIVMVVAVCDGFLSAAAIPEELDAAGITGKAAESFLAHGSPNLPLVARMNGHLDEWTLPMLATAKCRVTVEDPDGKPLPGTEVSAWPNPHFPALDRMSLGRDTAVQCC